MLALKPFVPIILVKRSAAVNGFPYMSCLTLRASMKVGPSGLWDRVCSEPRTYTTYHQKLHSLWKHPIPGPSNASASIPFISNWRKKHGREIWLNARLEDQLIGSMTIPYYCKTLKFREHFNFAQIRESELSKTFYGIKIGWLGAKLHYFKVPPSPKNDGM